MSKLTRYRGVFGSRGEVLWRVEIWQEGWTGLVGELSFCGEDPLLLEWEEQGFDESVCGSVATLRLLSPGDRTYADLFGKSDGDVGVYIWREDVLYWSGTLDAEFYEEPYAYLSDYEVSLTFSDFGLLERTPFLLGGMTDIQTLLRHCMSACCLHADTDVDLNLSRLWSLCRNGMLLDLSSVCIESSNFVDGDGDPLTLREVLDGVLLPLGFRLVQRCGRLCLYDLFGLKESGAGELVRWWSDDQLLSADRVYKSVKVTFSPNGSAKLLESTCDCNTGAAGSPDIYYEKKELGSENVDYVDFRLWVSGSGGGLRHADRYFKIEPVYGGGECKGVHVFSSYYSYDSSLRPVHQMDRGELPSPTNFNRSTPGTAVLKSKRVWLGGLTAGDSYLLRLTLELLCDGRYNPLSGSDENNFKNDHESMVNGWQFVFVPVRVSLYGSESGDDVLYHWDNESIAQRRDDNGRTLRGTIGSWEWGAGSWGAAWLEWYDPDDLVHGTGVGGWKSNRHCVGMTNELPKSLTGRAAGQYLPWPPCSGWLEVEVYNGLWPFSQNGRGIVGDLSTVEPTELGDISDYLRWFLYKPPSLTAVESSGSSKEVEIEKESHTSQVNAFAHEPLEIDTLCGMSQKSLPTAKGLYRRVSDGLPLTGLSRGGETGLCEDLLTSMLMEQYGSRRMILKGTASLPSSGPLLWRDSSSPGKLFALTGAVEDAGEDTVEVTLTEIGV